MNIIEEFRKEYRKAYAGILSEEVLREGNTWFEDFITTHILALAAKVEEIRPQENTSLMYRKGFLQGQNAAAALIRSSVK